MKLRPTQRSNTEELRASRSDAFVTFLHKHLVLVSLYVLTLTIVAAAFLMEPSSQNPYPFVRTLIIFFAAILLSKYFFYMIVSPWHDFKQARAYKRWTRRRPSYHPLVSVIIPAWNEEVGIVSTVRSVLENSYDNLEVIVVNDGSKDNSDAVLTTLLRQFETLPYLQKKGKRLRYRYKENGGKGSALNTGLAMSRGDIIVTIDADCFVESNAIEEFVHVFRDPSVMASVGNVKIGSTKSLIGLIQYMEFLFSFYFKKGDSVMNSIYIIGGAAGAYRRSVFQKLGGYSLTNITEDIELSMRIQNAGMKIVYASNAIVHTEGAADLTGLLKQRLRWKQGRIETFRAYRHMFFSRDPKHSKPLTFFALPLALLGDLQIGFEPWFLLFLYYISLQTGDFTSFLSGILVVSSMFFVQVFFDEPRTRKLSFVALAPIAWLLFYVMTLVEWNALVQAIKGYAQGKKVVWQRWERRGVHTS